MRKTPIWLAACLALLAAPIVGAHAEEGGDRDAFTKRLFAAQAVDHKIFACFVRRYDAHHLAHHPRQKVGAMKLLVVVDKVSETTELNYGFRLGVELRKQPGELETSGDCGHPAAEVAGESLRIHCSVDCDGGGVTVALANGDKSVMVKLNEIRVFPPAKPGQPATDDDPDHDNSLTLEGGADDRVFRLDRTDVEACKSIADDDDKLAALQAK